MADDKCVDKKQIAEAARVIIEVAKKTNKNDLTNPLEQQIVSLQLCFKKVPGIRNKIIQVPLAHGVSTKTTDICLFVKDLDAAERDYEPTVRHFKELLESNGISRHIEIIPVKSLKIDYQPYEAKRNLSNMFDLFMADERIMRLLPKYLGKHFLSRKKFPVPINLKAKKLKETFEKILNCTQCIISGKGSSCQVNVARTGMSADQISRNIELAVHKLTNTIPGGVDNVRNLNIKTDNSPALPIYVSLGSANDVKLPTIGRRNQEIETSELTTAAGNKVKIDKRGRIQLVADPDDSDSAGEAEEEIKDMQVEDEDDGEDEELKEEKETRKKRNAKRAYPEDEDEDEEEDDEDEDEDEDEDDDDSDKAPVKRQRVEDPAEATPSKKFKGAAKSPKGAAKPSTPKQTQKSAKSPRGTPKSPGGAKTPRGTPKSQGGAKSPKGTPKSQNIAKTNKGTPKSPKVAVTPKGTPKSPKVAVTPKGTPKSPKVAVTPKGTPKSPKAAQTPKSPNATKKEGTPKSRKSPKDSKSPKAKSFEKTPSKPPVKSPKQTPQSGKKKNKK